MWYDVEHRMCRLHYYSLSWYIINSHVLEFKFHTFTSSIAISSYLKMYYWTVFHCTIAPCMYFVLSSLCVDADVNVCCCCTQPAMLLMRWCCDFLYEILCCLHQRQNKKNRKSFPSIGVYSRSVCSHSLFLVCVFSSCFPHRTNSRLIKKNCLVEGEGNRVI